MPTAVRFDSGNSVLEDCEIKLKTTGEAIGIEIIGEHTAPQLLRCQVWSGETGIR
ncbi:MAG TPA: hypothetical protein IGP91_00505 [Thermosynechococcus sp. M46_R2017_013]|nr:hypothetical protein [Thermosynechococcus sp. M46_R2017_013]